jgi:predicted Zn-dependent peptidase
VTTIRRSDRLDEEVHESTTSDGLPVHVIPRPGYQSKFAILVADYGSVDNTFVPAGADETHTAPCGVAHFLEHKLFEDEAGDVFSRFAQHGASANAYTYYTETAYHFSASESFDECLKLLLDFVTTPFFTEKEIEKERKVIAQEIGMYEDSPDQRAHLNLMRCLFAAHPLRDDIAGTKESIELIDKPLLELCHKTFYRPDNMLLVVSGDLAPSRILDLVEAGASERSQRYGDLDAPLRRVVPAELPMVHEARADAQMKVALPKLLVGYKDEPVEHGTPRLKRARATGFLGELLFGRASAFFETHCASGLIDDTFSYSYHAGRSGYAYVVLGGESPDPEGVIAAIEANIARAQTEGLDPADFARLRNKAYGRFLRAFNSVEQVACGEADATLQGWDLLAYLDLLESLSLDEVQDRLAVFDPARRAVSVVRPI